MDFIRTLCSIRVKIFKRPNWQARNSDLSEVDWPTFLACDSINDYLQNSETDFFGLSSKHIPKIKVSNEFKPPWYDSEERFLKYILYTSG
jgi:hypothetical protein